jgi:hypothetical protein
MIDHRRSLRFREVRNDAVVAIRPRNDNMQRTNSQTHAKKGPPK